MFNTISINKSLLILIIIVGAVLRLYNFSSFSITADEVSAINRAQFSSFGELIENGVCKDTHPAGVQVFLYYWIKAFGTSEGAVRFPFVILGILSVLLVYLISKKWFNETTALLAASAVGFLQFPITYSQLARPYSPGMFFSLLTVLYWTKFLFEEKHKNKWIFIGFVLSVVAAMYTHYFSALFVVIVSFTGLFFLNKENYKQYLLAGVLVILLFMPHYKIFLIQFHVGGVGGEGGWLGKPKPNFIYEYIKYCFNNSRLIYGLFLLAFIARIILLTKKFGWKKFHSICLLWFFLPFVIGYYYSLYVNPLLQYSLLLFSFPFLVIFLLSFLPNITKSGLLIAVAFIFSGTIIGSTVFEKQFYSTKKFGVLKEIADNVIKDNKKYGEKNITRTINLIGPYSIHYYFSKYNTKPVFESYMNNGNKELSEFVSIVDSATTSYFIYAWSTRYSPPEIPEIIMSKYPNLLEKVWWYNSEYYLFSKKEIGLSEPPLFFAHNNFEQKGNGWGVNEKFIVDSMLGQGKYSVRMDSNIEYGPTFRGKVKDLFKSTTDILNVSVLGKLASETDDAQLVVSFEREGKSYDWHSNAFSFFIGRKNEWKRIFLSLRMPEQISLEDEVVIYIWNNSKRTIFIDDMIVKVNAGNPLSYGKRKEF